METASLDVQKMSGGEKIALMERTIPRDIRNGVIVEGE